MNLYLSHYSRRYALAAGLLTGFLLGFHGLAAQPELDKIPQSVFGVPLATGVGRNPFFPNSQFGTPIVKKTVPTPGETYSVTLNGLSGPPRRTAIINGRTFEPGEQVDIKNENGAKTTIKCEEIRDDSAIVLVNNERRTLRLRSSL